MKIRLRIEGLPQLYKILNKKKDLEFEFPGRTIRDFVAGLARKYGRGVDQALLDQQGAIDMGLRVAVNFSILSYENRMDTPLNEGDTIHLMTVG
jgi:molybdopterin converting factor small subunit